MATLKSTTTSIEKGASNLAVIAWIVILVWGELPVIVLRIFVPAGASEPYIPPWVAWVQVVLLAVFWLVTQISPSLKPLGGFTLALIAFMLGAAFIQPAIWRSAIVASWLNEASWGMKQIAIYGSKLITVTLMALTLIGSGIGRQELFLTLGNPRSPAKPTPFLPGLKEPLPWGKVVRNLLPFFIVPMLIVLWVQIRPDATQFSRVLIFLPAIILASTFNAFSEEFQFRSMLLPRLGPVLGASQAVLMTSVAFGLGHYGPANNPNGLFGASLAGYLGWVAAKSMIETRGLVWAFVLHFLADFVIFSFSAMVAG